MIPDEPDEDAANLDDDALLEAYLSPRSADPDRPVVTHLPDWPPLAAREIALPIDTRTLDWFREHHADWRREIRFVLKAWVAAQGAASPTPADTGLQPRNDSRFPPPAAASTGHDGRQRR